MTNDEIPNDEGMTNDEIPNDEGMTNDEMPNDEGNPNDESRIPVCVKRRVRKRAKTRIGIVSFSGFGFRIFFVMG